MPIRSSSVVRPSWSMITAVVLLVLVAFLTTSTTASGLRCEKVWGGPSVDNDVASCITNMKRIDYSEYILPLLCLIILFASILVFPILFCWCVCCQCCCECCKDVAVGDRGASRESRKYLLGVVVLQVVLAIVIFSLLIAGSVSLVSGINDVFTNLEVQVIKFFKDIVTHLQSIVVDPATGAYTAPFTQATFNTINNQIDNIQLSSGTWKTTTLSLTTTISGISKGLAIVPLLLFSVALLFHFCNIRRCLPSFVAIIYFALLIIFALAGALILFVGTVVGDVCTEIDLQTTRQPGIFQWYLIPECYSVADFSSLKAKVQTYEAQFASDACTAMTQFCSPSTTYDSNQPNLLFVCQTTPATAASDCPTFNASMKILQDAYAKSGSPACDSAHPQCTFAQCKDYCTDQGAAAASADALDKLAMATRLFAALDYVVGLMDCNTIVDRFLLIFASCHSIEKGFKLSGDGFFITLLTVIVGWVVMFKGQKLWFSPADYEEGDKVKKQVDESSASFLNSTAGGGGGGYSPGYVMAPSADAYVVSSVPMMTITYNMQQPQPFAEHSHSGGVDVLSMSDPMYGNQGYGGHHAAGSLYNPPPANYPNNQQQMEQFVL